MRVLDLPRRRYSVPETVMRKYRLRQRAEQNCPTSSSSSSGGNSSNGWGRQSRGRGEDKSCQTTPREAMERTSSFPLLVATPSPCAWSYTASDCQTVSDRTTSTQDSTLSVPSTTPEGPYHPTGLSEELNEKADRSTSITGLEGAVLNIAVSTETDPHFETDSKWPMKNDDEIVNTACQTGNQDLFKIPDINIFKDSSESQNEVRLLPLELLVPSFQTEPIQIHEGMDPIGYHARRLRADISCAGSNYDNFPLVTPVIPRYSAVPRTNSMVVNTSSIDYSSDSEASLTDSLEDPDEYRIQHQRKQSKHDRRLVRGEVAMEQERMRLPKSKDAYAYFLSLTGEEEIIREYSIPEWLRMRLNKREQETKKEYEDKLKKNKQCTLHRRKKKTIRRMTRAHSYSSGEKVVKNQNVISDHYAKRENNTVDTDERKNIMSKNVVNHTLPNKNPSTQLINGNNMGLEPKINNINRNNHNNLSNNNNGEHNKQDFTEVSTDNRNTTNQNLVQISEVIKIELCDNSRTVITKEKQINLSPEINLNESTSEILKNNDFSHSKKSVISNNLEASYSIESKTDHRKQIPQCSYKNVRGDVTSKSHIDIEEDVDRSKLSKTEKTFHQVPEIKVLPITPKAEDIKPSPRIDIERKIADVLISALEENTKARQMSLKSEESTKEKSESQSKSYVDQGSQKNEFDNNECRKNRSFATQTDNLKSDSDNESNNVIKKNDISCNTEPYMVSVFVQTSDNDSQDEDINDNIKIDFFKNETWENTNEIETSDDKSTENEKMVDKACNTVESVTISTQTNESILQSNDIVNRLKKVRNDKKKDVQFPPQVIKQIITGTGEYKTLDLLSSGRTREGVRAKSTSGKKGKVSKGTNTDEKELISENNKNILNNTSRTAPAHFCKNGYAQKASQKKSQVLEVNVPACTCHMCTLQKISPRGDTSKSKIPQSFKGFDTRDDRKPIQKFGTRRGNVIGQKFKMFEVIPEEKNSSAESVTEGEITKEILKGKECDKQEKGIVTEPELVDQIIQVGSNNVNAATNTDPNMMETNKITESVQTCDEPKRKSNLVIGRFRSEKQESPATVGQYKGRASLSAGHLEGHEQLLTLSKGWINFYLLKDNLDFSDSNGEEGPPLQQFTGRRRIQTMETEAEKVEEYTLEIHATPEPEQKQNIRGRVILPDINTSSSSSTPENEKCKLRKSSVEALPGVKKSKRTKNSHYREAITQVGSAYRSTDRKMSATRAVEVACSEQSISSITSSTVILSESPPPQPLKLPERRSHQRQRSHKASTNNGSNWTVTVAGSSGSGNDPPPDVEMKLTFGRQDKKQEGMLQYEVARTKRQDRMLEEFAHITRNERHSTQLQCAFHSNQHPKSCIERARGGSARDNFSYEEEFLNNLTSRRSKCSTEDGSEAGGDLHVTGLAITPEKKPRVPTQSERDILRPQRYKFTR